MNGSSRRRSEHLVADGDAPVLEDARRCRRARPPAPARQRGSASAGSARLPTITGWTNSTATWRASDSSPTASSRPPRRKRCAISSHSAASRADSAVKNSLFARVRSCVTPPPCGAPAARRASRGTRPRPRPCARSIDIHATPGCTVSQPLRPLRDVEVDVRQQVDLVQDHELAGAEHQRVLERLVLALGDRRDHHARVLADPELGRAHEVADVLDHEQVDLIQRDRRQRGAHHVRVQMALAAEPDAGLQLGHGHVQRGQPVGVQRALHVALEHARAHAAEVAAARARAAPSCPRPGAPIRFATVTPARSKSSRLARAIVLLASSASSTTRTLTRCIYIDRIFR